MENGIKNVIWNAVGSTVNAFNSLIFAIAVTRINGVDQAGIFSYAFANACLFYVVGSYIVRAFQVTDISGEFSDSDYIYNRIITCFIMILALFGFVTIKGYDFYKSAIILALGLFKCFEAFSEVLYGIVQKNNQLYKVGISLFIKATTAAIAFILIDYFTKRLLLSCAIIALVYLFLIMLYDIPVYKSCKRSSSFFSIKKIFKLFKIGFSTFVITVLGIFLINSSRYAIDDLQSNSVQTIYGIIIMPATFMCLLGQYIIQPCLTSISENIKQKNYILLRKIIARIILLMCLIGLGVFAFAFFLEEPVLSLIYDIDLKNYKSDMLIIILGSVFYGLETILSYVLISLRKTSIQAFVFAIVSLIAVLISYILVSNIGIRGASLTYLFIMLIISAALMICLLISMRRYRLAWNVQGEENENIDYNSGI